MVEKVLGVVDNVHGKKYRAVHSLGIVLWSMVTVLLRGDEQSKSPEDVWNYSCEKKSLEDKTGVLWSILNILGLVEKWSIMSVLWHGESLYETGKKVSIVLGICRFTSVHWVVLKISTEWICCHTPFSAGDTHHCSVEQRDQVSRISRLFDDPAEDGMSTQAMMSPGVWDPERANGSPDVLKKTDCVLENVLVKSW